ncbi:hypothetical protein OIO90_000837 [Microbotryomycetes sp. JL221]|nr:hypothetical protein OIO90_000837 [Microbotryomycetes sp. JL221]
MPRMQSTPMSRRRSSQQARRLSIPSTPPETPVKEFFPPKGQRRLSSSTTSVNPILTPPVTPTRLEYGSKKYQQQQDDQQEVLTTFSGPPPSGRRLSHAFAVPASHRRAPTGTLIRVAMSTQAGRLVPAKVVVIVLAIFSAGYMASLLSIPSPLSLIKSTKSGMSTVGNPSMPSRMREIEDFEVDMSSAGRVRSQSTATRNIGDRTERQAWGQSAVRPPRQAQAVRPEDNHHDIADSYEIVAQAMRLQAQRLENEGWGKARRRRPIQDGARAPNVFKAAMAGGEPGTEESRNLLDDQATSDDVLEEDDVRSVDDDETFEDLVGRGTETERKVAAAVGVKSEPERRPFNGAAAADSIAKANNVAAAPKGRLNHHAKPEQGKSYEPKQDSKVGRKMKKISKVSEAKKAPAKIGVIPVDSSPSYQADADPKAPQHKTGPKGGGKRRPMPIGHRLSSDDSELAKPKDVDVMKGRGRGGRGPRSDDSILAKSENPGI